MTASPFASDAKIAAALTAIGATSVANNEQALLQQILVAAATASGGGGGSGEGTITPAVLAPEGWDEVWSAAYAARSTTPAWVTVVGDSIATGSIAGDDWFTNGWVSQLRAALAGEDLAGLSSEYFSAIGRQTNETILGANTDSPWSNIENGATPVFYENVGWHPTEYFLDTTVAIQTFTVPYDCTEAKLLVWSQYSSSGYKINGGATVTLTHSGPAWALRTVSLGPLEAGDTVQWGFQAAAQAAILGGISLTKAATGVGLGRMVAGGTKLLNIAGRGQVHYPSAIHGLWAGISGQSTALLTPESVLNYGFPTQPHLAIIALGVNDVASDNSVSNFKSALDYTAAAFRRGRQNCSLLFLIYNYPNQDISDATNFIATPSAAPAISVQGTPGATEYRVRYAWRGYYGVTDDSAEATVANGPAALSGTDFIRVTLPTAPVNAPLVWVFWSTDAGSTWQFNEFTPATTIDITAAGSVTTLPTANTTELPYAYKWETFVEAFYAIAAKWGAAVVNIDAAWSSNARALGYLEADIHPSETGHENIAEYVIDLVVPPPTA